MKKDNSKIIRGLFILSFLAFAPAFIEAAEAESLIDSDCRIQTRRRFTRKWSEFSGTFKRNTQVKFLNKPGAGADSPVIFSILYEPGVAYKMFEFKAPKSCFSSYDGELKLQEVTSADGDALPMEESSNASWKRQWTIKLLYYKFKSYFKALGTDTLYDVNNTQYGLGVGLNHEHMAPKHRVGIAWGLLMTLGKAENSSVLAPKYSESTKAIGLHLDPYYTYMVGPKIGLGVGLSSNWNWVLYPSSVLGGMTSSIQKANFLTLRMDYYLKKIKLGLDAGFSLPLDSWLLATRVEF